MPKQVVKRPAARQRKGSRLDRLSEPVADLDGLDRGLACSFVGNSPLSTTVTVEEEGLVSTTEQVLHFGKGNLLKIP
jgi:hypothetical protein